MNAMAQIKTFNREELLDLLWDCAQNLALCYQENLDQSLNLTSAKAFQACDYLLYEIQKEQFTQTTH
ncbi:MAG: hypothetical protein H0U57_06065 [Tatlockia sp.]|nr:hypothetical protein [Tatlockia sp.]